MALKLHLIFTTAFERLQEQGKMIALFRRVSKSTIEKKKQIFIQQRFAMDVFRAKIHAKKLESTKLQRSILIKFKLEGQKYFRIDYVCPINL